MFPARAQELCVIFAFAMGEGIVLKIIIPLLKPQATHAIRQGPNKLKYSLAILIFFSPFIVGLETLSSIFFHLHSFELTFKLHKHARPKRARQFDNNFNEIGAKTTEMPKHKWVQKMRPSCPCITFSMSE